MSKQLVATTKNKNKTKFKGLILFLIHIHDIPNVFTSAHIILFCDDVTIFQASILKFHGNLLFKTSLSYWCFNNSRTIKRNKTHFMPFSNKTRYVLPDIKIIHYSISKSRNVKFLVFFFSGKFNL